jgi:WD40 repeat protein
MNGPESAPRTDSRLAEQLVAYDAALDAGVTLCGTRLDDLPAGLRDGLSCLEMLERVRLGDRKEDTCGGPATHTPPRSPADTAIGDAGSEALDDVSTPVQLGRFEILRILGQGGCGVVMLARDPRLDRLIALKIPRPERLLNPEMRQRFLREGRAAGGLDHPNLLPVFEAGEIGAVCYLASPYCPGITLRGWLSQHPGPADTLAAARLIATLADAMHHAHQKGICHRDLKPSNILLCRKTEIRNAKSETNPKSECQNPKQANPGFETSDCGFASNFDIRDSDFTLKIIDFGLAKILDEAGGDAVTGTGAVLGTPQYMAPEQAEGRLDDIGPHTDLYALGVILYELLARRTPFRGQSDVDTLRRIVADEPVRIGLLRPEVPRDLETICLKCLEKQPENRYGSMRELGDDLGRFLEGRPICARRIGWAARAMKWARRRPRATAAGVLTGVLLFSLAAVLVWSGGRESAHNADMSKALQEIGLHKAVAEERDWLARNHKYAAQIRAGWLFNKDSQLAALRDVLLAQKPGPGQKDVRGFEWHYLWRVAQDVMLPGHNSLTTAIAYSANGNVCAVGSEDGAIDLFDRRTGKPLGTLAGLGLAVRTLDFLKDDTQLLATAFTGTGATGFRGEFVLWSLGVERKVLRRGSYSHARPDFGHPIFALAPAARILFVIDRGSTQHRLLRLDLETGAERLLLTSEKLILVASTRGADKLALVRRHSPWAGKWHHCSLEILDLVSNRQVSARHFDKSVHTAAFSPDGATLAVAVGLEESPRFVEIREMPSLRLRKSLEFPLIPEGLRFDWQGKRLSVSTGQTHFHLFDVDNGNSLGSFKHDRALPMALAFSPDGEELALGGPDGRVRTGKNVFMPRDDSLLGSLPKSEGWCLAFTPDGNTLAAGYDHEKGMEHQTARLWDITTKQAKSLTGHDATVMALAVSPDGSTLATASYDRTVRLWDMAVGKCLHELRGHTDAVRAVAFSPDGERVASAGSDLSIRTWNVKHGTLEGNWPGHGDMIRSLAFSPDGKLLISAANDRTIKIWNATAGTLLRAIAAESNVQSVACSPDGVLLASGSENHRVDLWQLATGKLWKTLPGHTGKVRSVAFSPDGKTLASGGEDKTVRLRSVVTGQELLVFPTEHFVNGLAFHARKPILAAALHDGTVKLWSGE